MEVDVADPPVQLPHMHGALSVNAFVSYLILSIIFFSCVNFKIYIQAN